MDWQPIAMLALGALSGIIWYEVRQLRHAKHSNAQHIQYALICIALIARHVGVELPPKEDDK
jgi:hypothetical protein